MHETAIARSALAAVLERAEINGATRVSKIRLVIGALRDVEDEMFETCLLYFAKGSVAEGAAIEIYRTPILAFCERCGEAFEIPKHSLGLMGCPKCGTYSAKLLQGREFYIDSIDVDANACE